MTFNTSMDEGRMQRHDDCMHEEDFKRLEGLVERVFSRMDVFLAEMRELMISEARRQEQMSNMDKEIMHLRVDMTKDIDALGSKIRTVGERLQTLSDWRQRFEGGIKVMMAIPVFCTVVTTGVAIYKMMGP